MNFLKLLPRFRNAYVAIDELKNRTRWTREQIESFQLQRLNRLWQGAAANVVFYQELKQLHSLPNEFRSLDEFRDRMPLLTKELVRNNTQKLLSNKASPGTWLRTGGSTGQPTSIYWSHESHMANLRNRYRWLAENDIDFLDRHAFLWGHAGSFAPGIRGVIARIRQPIEDSLRRRLRLSAYALGPDDLDEYLRRIIRYRPRFMYGYSTAIYLLARRAIETGIKCDSLKMMIMTAEPAVPKYSQAIRQAFNADGLIEYGSCETGLVALEDGQAKLRILDDSRLVETLPRPDGAYDIAVTVLDNPSFPLIRYSLGDMTSEAISIPADGFSILKDVHGRNNDFLVAQSGKLVHSLAVKHSLEDIPEVSRFQALQDRNGSLTMIVEMHDRTDTLDESRICRNVSELLDGFSVTIRKIDCIPGNRAGKHTWVVSELFKEMESGADNSSRLKQHVF